MTSLAKNRAFQTLAREVRGPFLFPVSRGGESIASTRESFLPFPVNLPWPFSSSSLLVSGGGIGPLGG